MKLIIIIAVLIVASTVRSETNVVLRQPSVAATNALTITLRGEIKALSILAQREVTVPWQKWYTLEQVIRDMGGFTEYSTSIVVTDAEGKRTRYTIAKEFKGDKTVREMKLQPGMHILVYNME